MSKFLIVTEHFLPTFGGGVRYLAALVDYLRQCGHTVDVLTMGKEWRTSYETSEGGTIIRLGEHLKVDSGRLSASILPFMLRHLSNYDLVHWNAPNPIGELGCYAARLMGKRPFRSVCAYHAEVVETKPFSRLYNRWLLSNHFKPCDALIVGSPNFLNSSPLLQKYKEKVEVIPYGIDMKKYYPAPDWNPEAVRHNGKPLRFIFVGRLVEYKGLPFLLEALKQASGHLDIIGAGPMGESAQQFVVEAGLSDRVTFHGKVTDEMSALLHRNADVIVLPSINRGESFGYALVEGMARGLAAISTEIGTGTSFVNLDRETGLVLPPRDVTALVKGMRYLDEHRSELAQMKRKARQRVLDYFTQERMLLETEALFKRLDVLK